MPCVDNKNLIYNIKELPETFSVAAGDMLIIETDDGTNIMDFNNFVIGLDNTTFGTTITQHSSDINTLYNEFDALSSQVDTDIAAMSATVDAAATAVESAASAAGLGSDSALLEESGYQILPSGLIMQWGVSERTTGFQEEEEVTFPMAFPTGCLNIVGQLDYPTFESGNLSVYLKETTTTGATFVYDSDGETYPNAAIRWQAFGH